MDRLIKVFGERNTATRAVIGMIDAAPGIQGVAHEGVPEAELARFDDMIAQAERVFRGPWKRVYREAIRDLRVEASGPLGAWKHGAPVFNSAYAQAGVAVIFMVRNPYSWITSFRRRPYHNMGRRSGRLPEFLDRPWLTVGRDNLDRILPSPMSLWSLKIAAYQRFEAESSSAGVPTAWLRFEDFVQDPTRTLQRILEDLDCPNRGIHEIGATKPFQPLPEARKAYYDQEGWREDLCAHSVALIDAHVDWDLATRFGYARLSAEDFKLHRKGRAAPAGGGRVGIFDHKSRADDLRRIINGRVG